jgi:hypothetical protein
MCNLQARNPKVWLLHLLPNIMKMATVRAKFRFFSEANYRAILQHARVKALCIPDGVSLVRYDDAISWQTDEKQHLVVSIKWSVHRNLLARFIEHAPPKPQDCRLIHVCAHGLHLA